MKPEWMLTSVEIMQLQEFKEGDNESIGYERNISNFAQRKLLEYLTRNFWHMRSRIESMIEQLEEK